jgi:predicted metal-dependent hydrolase
MRSVQYGSKLISYSIQEKEGLKSHYISVEKHTGVVLKGKPLSDITADRLILKKAKWILNKLDVVKIGDKDEIVTGSRIPYLGKNYYVQVKVDRSVKRVAIEFTQSKFIITVNSQSNKQRDIESALQNYYHEKAIEKITPRIKSLSQKIGLEFQGLQIRKMTKRWGSCTGLNRIIINTDAVKLPCSLIDYLIIHELCHTKVKDHSKEFWAELSKHVVKWKDLDKKMADLKV